jgi:hypothetical protein
MTAGATEPTLRGDAVMVRLWRLLPVALIALATVFVAGCGGSQGAGAVALPMLDDLTPVADATDKADSAKFEMTFSMDVPGFDAPLAFSANGAFDTPARKAQMTMDLSSFAKLMSGVAGALGGNAPDELTDASKWKLEMRVDGTDAYMRMPFLESQLPSGKEWVQVDLAKAAALRGVDLGEIQSFAKGSDPRETLDYLRSIAGKLTRIGTEDVRGVSTAHYFAAVDWQKALARAAKKSGQQGFLAQLQSMPTAVASVPVDVWVDEANLVRRMKLSFVFTSPGQSQQAKAAMEMELFDYGEPVTVEAPRASDVVDAFALRAGG